jgi:hypothetical protein
MKNLVLLAVFFVCVSFGSDVVARVESGAKMAITNNAESPDLASTIDMFRINCAPEGGSVKFEKVYSQDSSDGIVTSSEIGSTSNDKSLITAGALRAYFQ